MYLQLFYYSYNILIMQLQMFCNEGNVYSCINYFFNHFLGNSITSTNYSYKYDIFLYLSFDKKWQKRTSNYNFCSLPDKVSLLFPGQSESIQGMKMNYLFIRLICVFFWNYLNVSCKHVVKYEVNLIQNLRKPNKIRHFL